MTEKKELANFFSWRTLAYNLLGMSAAILLLIVLFARLDVSLEDVIGMLTDVPFWGLLLIALFTLAAFWLSSYQWQLTLRTTSPDQPVSPFIALWFYTALGTLLGQLIPVQISVLAVRSLAFRLRQQGTFTRGGATSLVEQGSALYISLLFFIPGLFALFGLIGISTWLIMTLGVIGVGWVMMVLLVPWLVRALSGILRDKRGRAWHRLAWVQKTADVLNKIIYLDLLNSNVLGTLFLFSLIRYLLMTARIMMIIHVVSLNIPLRFAFYIVPVVQLTRLLNLTPGNLGLREWTWVGLLTLAGVETTDAATYAIAQSVLVFVSVVSAWLVVFLIFGISEFRAKCLLASSMKEEGVIGSGKG